MSGLERSLNVQRCKILTKYCKFFNFYLFILNLKYYYFHNVLISFR